MRALSPALVPLGLQLDLVGGSVGSGFPANPATCHCFIPPVLPVVLGPAEASERERGREEEGEGD